ncbi:MAG: glycosyltransferase [Muribaculaceae bacterium]
MTTLDVLICTLNEGILRVKNVLLQPQSGIRYVVSWQQDGYKCDIPPELIRSDVAISTISGRGLSRNRNNAIAQSTADICLIADDDVKYTPDSFRAVINTFESNPNLDIATFRSQSEFEQKIFPDYQFNLAKPTKGYYATSFEIAFRRKSIARKLRFNELFGLGAPVLHAGEENVFIIDAVRQGLDCRFFPITIVTHNHPTTGVNPIQTPGTLMAQGAYIYIAYRDCTAPLRYVLKAWRMSRSTRTGFFSALWYITKGAAYARRHLNIS